MDQIKDYIPEAVKDFDILQHLDKRIVTGLSLYGAYHLTKSLFGPVACQVGQQLVFRKNLKERYANAEWVMVTGGTETIGQALCNEFAKAGFNILIVSKSNIEAMKVAKTVKKDYGVQASVIKYDFATLTNENEAQNLQKKILDSTKGKNVGILVNNVTLSVTDPTLGFHKLDFSQIMQMMSTNIFSQTVMTRIMAAKWLEERKG